MLNRRARHACVREGHGDLRADAVYLTADGIRIIDCLEFDERLRYGDIANEIAFLAMDLDRLGSPELGLELVRPFVTDPDFAVLLPFYKAYRATVRAKVELLRSQQADCGADEQTRSFRSALHLLDLAHGYGLGPKIALVVCGLSGTGKSTVAASLAEHLGLEVFSSDLIRKELAGVPSGTSAAASYGEGIYSPDVTTQVYESILSRARSALTSGRGVILDATFITSHQRERLLAMSRESGVEPLFVECRAGRDEIIRRLTDRQRRGGQNSDADVDIYLSQAKQFEPLNEIAPASHYVADTSGNSGDIVANVERRAWAMHYRKA